MNLLFFEWLPAGSLKVEAGFLVDPLSITMALFVTGVGALIHLYSIGYMHGDEKYSKFFVSKSFLVLDAHARLRQQLSGHVSGLGRRGSLLLFPYFFLASTRVCGHCREEGVRHQPRW